MDQNFGKRLRDLRKAQGLSQREFAEKLSISFQSVSKWENGSSYPNISLIPTIAGILKTSCDNLIGYENVEVRNKYFQLYQSDEYFWSTDPNPLSYKLLQMCPPKDFSTVLELGCGEGRDAVFFGMNRYDVTAIDKVSTGIDKGLRLAEAHRINVNFLCADIRTYTSKGQYDLIFGNRSLHYLKPEEAQTVVNRYKDMTRVGGINAFTIPVSGKFFLPPAPDQEDEVYRYRSGELFRLYSNWELLYINEEIVDCNSSGIPHQHCIDTVIARKPSITAPKKWS